MSGSLGRATIDLDANLGPLNESLRRSKAEVQAWIKSLEKGKPKVEPQVQAKAALAQLEQVEASARRLNGLNPTVTVRTNAQGAITSMRVTTKSAGQMGAAGKKAGADMSQAFDGAMDSLSPVPLTMAGIGAGAVMAGAVVASFFKGSLDEAMAFEQGMAQVWTLLPQRSAEAMDEMGDQVKRFAMEFGVLPNEVIPALYEALGSGVPVGNVFDFLEVAQQAAIGGNTTLMVSTSALTSVVNAYGASNLSAAKAADIYFRAIDLGKLTMDQLAGSMYDVAPTAAVLGVGLEQVAAAMATMTAQGVPARVSATQLRQVLLELSDSGSQVSKTFQQITGKSFKEFIDSGGTLQSGLVLLEEHAAKTGVTVNELFSSVEAGSGALTLTGNNAQKAASDLAAAQDSYGATAAAAEKTSGTTTQSAKEMSSAWATLKIEVGQAISPAAGAAFDRLAGVLVTTAQGVGLLTDLVGSLADVLGMIPGPVLKFVEYAGKIGMLLTPIGQMAAGWKMLGSAIGFASGEAEQFSMVSTLTVAEAIRLKAEAAAAEAEIRGVEAAALDLSTTFIGPQLLPNPMLASDLIGGVETFVDWLQNRIPAAGAAALGSIDTVVDGIDSGFGSAGDAVDAFIRNGQIGYTEFVELATSKLADLERARVQAFNDEDGEALSAANQGIQIYSDLIAEATRRADDFAAAQQNWNSVQMALDGNVKTASDNISEWESDLSEAEKALGILNDKKEAGIPLTEQEASQYETLSWWVERTTGGIEDQEGAYVDAVTAKAKFAQMQEEIATKYPDLVHGSDEWKAAMTEAGLAAGMSEEQIAGLISGSGDLQTSIGDLVTAINNLLVGLGLIPAETDATVNVDTNIAEEAIGTVKEGFTEFDGGEAQGTLKVDNEPAMTATDDASKAAVSYAEAEYMAQVEADPAVALREIASAQTDADDFVGGGPYTALLDADDQASQPIADVGTRIRALIDGNYAVHITADISAVYAAVEQANALLPHSPAKEGPLARTPKWDWAFEGAVPAAERYVTQSADDAARFLPVGGQPNRGALSGPVSWSWLFRDIPADAEDYAAQTADSFVTFLLGNLDDIANGSAMYDAQQTLAELLAIREIAVSQNLGADVIAQIDAQIASQHDQIAAIGAVAGSGFVDGFKDVIEQFDLGDALQPPPGGSGGWSLDDIVSGDALDDQLAAIEEMQNLLRIAQESGNQELVDLYTAQLAELERQLAVLHDIMGTDTVQDLQDTADAAAAAAEDVANLVDAFLQMGRDPVGAVESAYSAVDALWRSVHAAVAAGAPAEVVEELLRQYNEALAAAALSADQAAQMYQLGLISDEELRAMGEAGGQAFIDAFNDAMGNPNAWADLEAAWDLVRQKSIDELRAMIPDMEDGGVSLIAPLIQGVLDGTQDFDDALSLLNDIAARNGEGLEATLGDLYLSLMEDLQEAYALGTDPTIIQQNLQIVLDMLAAMGLEIDDVLAAAAKAARTAESWKSGHAITRSGNRGGGSPAAPLYGPGTTYDAMAAMAAGPSVIDSIPASLTTMPVGGSGSSGWAGMASQGAAPIVNVNVNSQHTIDGRPLTADVIQRIESEIPAGMRS